MRAGSPDELWPEKEGAVTPPGFPYFGQIDYSITQETVEAVAASRPDLRATAIRFAETLRPGFRSGDIDPLSVVVRPDIDRVIADVTKWHEIVTVDGVNATLRHDGKWLVSDRYPAGDAFRPLDITASDEASSITLLERDIVLADNLPAGWQDRQWVNIVLHSSDQRLVGEPTVVSAFVPEAGKWQAISEMAERLDPSLLALASRLIEAVKSSTFYGNWFFLHFDRDGDTVYSICLSTDTLVKAAPWSATVLPEVSVDEFRAAVSRYRQSYKDKVRPVLEDRIRRFANPEFGTLTLPGLDYLLDRETRRGPTLEWAEGTGPDGQHSQRLQQLLAMLCGAHGIEAVKGQFRRTLGWNRAASIPGSRSALSAAELEEMKRAYLEGGSAPPSDPLAPDGVTASAVLKRDGHQDEVKSTVVLHIANLPHDEIIERVVAFRPDAEPVLRAWRAAWDKSFPGWQAASRWQLKDMEKTPGEYAVAFVDKTIKYADRGDPAAVTRLVDDTLSSDLGVKRDPRLHVIDDAFKAMCMTSVKPSMGMLDAAKVIIRYSGTDETGTPRFSVKTRELSRNRVWDRLSETPDYWNWQELVPHLGRRSRAFDSAHAAAVALSELGRQGATHAFVKLGRGRGAWKFPLASVTSPAVATRLLEATIGAATEYAGLPVIVQDFIDISREQRFFVIGGRVVASACPDRALCALDATGKRLDDRVAVTAPTYDALGRIDRGGNRHETDRAMAVAFARKARAIATALRAAGVTDYCLDIGMTDRDVVCIDVGSVDAASPFSLDRGLFVRAFERKRRAMGVSLRASIDAAVASLTKDERLLAWCASLLDRNVDRLADIVATQYDIMSVCRSSSDQDPTNLIEGVALSTILTALLERPVPVSAEQNDDTADRRRDHGLLDFLPGMDFLQDD